VLGAPPPLALVDDGTIFARLAGEALRWLRDGGTLAVEIDARRGVDVAETFRRDFVDVRVEPDLAGRDRVVVARAP
jgi:methylase of polypeptide subunit release factors